MSIAILIPEKWEPAFLVQWSIMSARARGEDLLIIRANRRRNSPERRRQPLNIKTDESPLAAALRQYANDFAIVDLRVKSEDDGPTKASRSTADRQPHLFVQEIDCSNLVQGVLIEIRKRRVVQLIVPRQRGVRLSEEEFATERQLFLEAPCETLQLRPGKSTSGDVGSVLVATSGSRGTKPALKVGAAFAADNQENVTALFVEQAGATTRRIIKRQQKNVDRSVRRSLKAHAQCVTRDTVADEDVSRGVCSYAAAGGHEVVIVGAGRYLLEERRLSSSVPEKLLNDMHNATVIVVRNAMPLAGRLLKSIERRKQSVVPQLDRKGRIELVDRLQAGANWDFDFVFLIFLATLIAGLGLVLDSPPVVIGAMLVAPIMTPMLGLGLSVVQGNRRLASRCLRTIGRGFVVAMATGCALGMLRILFTSGVTEQMSNRGAPGALDLAVAFVSGVVAAYAFGRPHLLSVLPGIAIATSLVPPIATVGLALSALELDIALGATLLFVSNATAIVLGSASALWIVGMRGPREVCPFTSWAQRWIFGLLGLAGCLAVFFTVKGGLSQVHASSDVESGAPSVTVSTPAEPIVTDLTPKVVDNVTNQRPAKPENPSAPENGQVRIVLKPPVTSGEQQSGGNITVILPNRPVAERGEGQATEDPPRARRREPLLRLFQQLRRAAPPSFEGDQQR